jgi:DNA-binding response OmpR family regulator
MVLVVDDHPQLRQTAVNLLHVLGHQTLQAQDAVEAENHVRRRGREIQVALLDINLGGHLGSDLAGRLEQASPGLRVLMMSGYQPEDLDEPGLEGRAFLGKPFSASALEAALKRLVAAG